MDPQYYLFSSYAVPNKLEVARIEVEIAQLAKTIGHLRAQLREQRSQLRQRLAAISSVRRVPLEILGEIFGFTLPEAMDCQGRGELVNLCLVCKAWRDAALLKHRLWSNIAIETSSDLSYDSITGWLKRSGNVPRTMEVGAYCCNTAERPCTFGDSTLTRLLTEGVSLDRLIIWSTSTQCLATMMAALEAHRTGTSTTRPWDSIRILRLSFCYTWNEPADPSKSVFLHIPPSVKSLELSTPYVDSDVDLEEAPFYFPPTILQGLTSFDFRLSRPGTRMFSTIQHCVNVQTLILSLDSLPMRYDPDDPFIRHISQFGLLLPKVHTLRLKSHPAESTEFFDFLRTPSLRELDIGFDNWTFLGRGDLAAALENFVKKSGCERSLRTLRLAHSKANEEELAAALLAVPFLTHVTLEDLNFNARVLLRHLRTAADVDEKPSLPYLECLGVLRASPEFQFEELLEFLEDRQLICGGLCDDWRDGFTTLTMTYQQPVVKVPKVNFWSPENLQRARRLGLSVSFGQVPNPRLNET